MPGFIVVADSGLWPALDPRRLTMATRRRSAELATAIGWRLRLEAVSR